jgi:hypothetical protein
MIGENHGFTREAMGGVMQDRDSFYNRAIRTKLGVAPRDDQKEPLPDPSTKALFELYQQEKVAADDSGHGHR